MADRSVKKTRNAAKNGLSAHVPFWAWVWRNDKSFCKFQTSYSLKNVQGWVVSYAFLTLVSLVWWSFVGPTAHWICCRKLALALQVWTSLWDHGFWLGWLEQNTEAEKLEIKFHGTCTELLPCWLFPTFLSERLREIWLLTEKALMFSYSQDLCPSKE